MQTSQYEIQHRPHIVDTDIAHGHSFCRLRFWEEFYSWLSRSSAAKLWSLGKWRKTQKSSLIGRTMLTRESPRLWRYWRVREVGPWPKHEVWDVARSMMITCVNSLQTPLSLHWRTPFLCISHRHSLTQPSGTELFFSWKNLAWCVCRKFVIFLLGSKEGYWGQSKRGRGKWRNSCAIVQWCATIAQ